MNLLKGRIERDRETTSCVVGDGRLPVGNISLGAALSAYEGAELAVGIRPERLGDPGTAANGRPRLRGRVKFVELLGSERLVQLELDATPMVAVEGSPARAIVSARFDAHAPIAAGDDAELAVAVDHLHFFDLETGEAIG
jgi:multiple sugar transport system ATP-binding protein